jgi:ABC-type lipopolysaccharide export system ATPase subunit
MIVEHNLQSILEIVDRAYVLDKGKVAVEDVPKNIIHSNILEKVFLN